VLLGCGSLFVGVCHRLWEAPPSDADRGGLKSMRRDAVKVNEEAAACSYEVASVPIDSACAVLDDDLAMSAAPDTPLPVSHHNACQAGCDTSSSLISSTLWPGANHPCPAFVSAPLYPAQPPCRTRNHCRSGSSTSRAINGLRNALTFSGASGRRTAGSSGRLIASTRS
jgi:hypothetical protein